MTFEFTEYVRSIRYCRWKIDNVGTRVSKVFALQFVFGLTNNKTIKKVSGRLNSVRRKWIHRLRDLATSELWTPTQAACSPYDPDFDIEKFASAFRRCIFCRPTVAHFYSKTGAAVKIRPCWRAHICPFCWANITIAQYVYVKNVINKLLKQHSDLVAVCRVVREYVPAAYFNPAAGTDPFLLPEHAAALKAVICKHKTRHSKLVEKRTLSRKTLGSLWRVVVIPDEAGWQVEVRQFFVCRAGVKPPLANTKNCRVVFSRSIRLNNARLQVIEDFYNLFGEFCRYPIELLTGYQQLTAAYLHAVTGLRLISGTGVFSKTSQRLMLYMREYTANARARRAAKKANRTSPGIDS